MSLKRILKRAGVILLLAMAVGASWWLWRQPHAVASSRWGDFAQLSQHRRLRSVKAFDDVCGRDLSRLDLAARPALVPTLSFNLNTVWPPAEKMPPGLKTEALLTAAKNPGLGVRELHRQGITGKGVHVAIIDQPLLGGHPEYAGKIVAYWDVGCGNDASMHGPAVASLLVGTHCGIAPDARLSFVAAPSWTLDSAYYAKALDWIVETNAHLPADQKIRIVSVSAAPSGLPFKKNTELWNPACQRAEAAGILVLDCSGFVFPSYYDSRDTENVAKVTPGFPRWDDSRQPDNEAKPEPGMSGRPTQGASRRPQSTAPPPPSPLAQLFVPCSLRTFAEEFGKGRFGHQYNGRGGLSWSIPYCAGVMALGWQVRSDLSGPEMRELLLRSAYLREDGAKIIQPKAFIELVKQAPPIHADQGR